MKIDMYILGIESFTEIRTSQNQQQKSNSQMLTVNRRKTTFIQST